MHSTDSPNPVAASSDGASQYDFKPFLSAPAVLEKAEQNGWLLHPLHIPESTIPSPLAQNISPNQLLGLKALLVGSGPKTSSRTGNGAEVWLSWKRAWDLWNNHYIHGRVNPIWVKREWERRQKPQQRFDGFDRDFREVPHVETTDRDGNGLTSTISGSDEELLSLSGGFRAIKDFPEFKAPPQYDPGVGDDDIDFDDPINNTVWAPRRVGEKTVKVDIDLNSDEFLSNSDLERDRGVDCGWLPYPVLRPLIEYVQLENGVFMKKKIWDGVTRTLFNLPTKPLVPTQEPEDKKLEIVKQVFGDPCRDFKPMTANEDIFPLDIRRIRRVHPIPAYPRVIPLLLENRGDVLLHDRRTRKDLPPFKYRNMLEDDAWYVTKEQKTLMDYPFRRYPPPKQKYTSAAIPVDDKIFREEFESDQLNLNRYFVTNQHGGTLIINGVEVRKGDIAGPLPKFAVIECPGGQIAFWFGSYGRNYLAGTEESPHLQWKVLRQRNGWKYTGLSAGRVWNAKVKDKIERKRSGEDEDDDEQWEEWLNTVAPQEPSAQISVTYQLPLPGQRRGESLPLPDNIAQPHVMFPSEEHELAWLTAQQDCQGIRADVIDTNLLPEEMQFFPGSQPFSAYVERKSLTQNKVNDIWIAKRDSVQKLQQAHVDCILDEKEKARAEEERFKSYRVPAKRKNEELSESRPKRRRIAREAIQISGERVEKGLQRELETGPPRHFHDQSIEQLQHTWAEYTIHRREQQRKQREEETTIPATVRKQDKANLVANSCPLIDAKIKWKILNEKEEAIKARQLQKEKQRKRAQEDAELREYANNIDKIIHGNSTNKLDGAQYEQLRDFNPTQSKNQTTDGGVEFKQQTSQPLAAINPDSKDILHYAPESSDNPSELDFTFANTTTGFEESDLGSLSDLIPIDDNQAILQAMEQSKQTHGDNIKQTLTQSAIAAYKSAPEYLDEQGYSNMEQCIDTFMADTCSSNHPNSTAKNPSAQQDFKTFLNTLRMAYSKGLIARAKLQDMSLDKYTQSEFSLNPDDYLDLLVKSYNLTIDDMPARVNEEMDSNDEAIAREKWSMLCDLVTEANDFEAQTLATSLPTETHIGPDGKPSAVI